MLKYISHVIDEYLGHTLNWVHTQIRHVPNYDHYVMTGKVMNLDSYPVQVFHPKTAPVVTSNWNRLIQRLGYMPLQNYRCYSKTLRMHRPILINAHFGCTGFFMLSLKKKYNLPLITRYYGYDIGILPRMPIWKTRYRQLFAEGDLFIVEGTNMRSTLVDLGCPEEKIYVHHLGIELEQIEYRVRNSPHNVIRVLMAGTFKEKKGFKYALRALKAVTERLANINVIITVIGDGMLKDELYSLAYEIGLYDSIKWMGYQSHDIFVKALNEADLFLAPSVTAINGDTEGGAPVAIIEASASGIPVVATTHADIPEVVLDGKTGYLAPERNVEMLVEAICRLALNPELRREFGRCARLHIEENYEAVQQGKKLTDIYAYVESECVRAAVS